MDRTELRILLSEFWRIPGGASQERVQSVAQMIADSVKGNPARERLVRFAIAKKVKKSRGGQLQKAVHLTQALDRNKPWWKFW